jgi:hypothetical protein
MRHGQRDRHTRSRDQRLKLAIGTADKSLNDLVRQNSLALADLGDVVAGLAQFVRQR